MVVSQSDLQLRGKGLAPMALADARPIAYLARVTLS